MTEGWLAAFGITTPLPPQTDAIIGAQAAEIERLREIVYRYVDPFDVALEDEDFVQATQRAALEQSK